MRKLFAVSLTVLLIIGVGALGSSVCYPGLNQLNGRPGIQLVINNQEVVGQILINVDPKFEILVVPGGATDIDQYTILEPRLRDALGLHFYSAAEAKYYDPADFFQIKEHVKFSGIIKPSHRVQFGAKLLNLNEVLIRVMMDTDGDTNLDSAKMSPGFENRISLNGQRVFYHEFVFMPTIFKSQPQDPRFKDVYTQCQWIRFKHTNGGLQHGTICYPNY